MQNLEGKTAFITGLGLLMSTLTNSQVAAMAGTSIGTLLPLGTVAPGAVGRSPSSIRRRLRPAARRRLALR